MDEDHYKFSESRSILSFRARHYASGKSLFAGLHVAIALCIIDAPETAVSPARGAVVIGGYRMKIVQLTSNYSGTRVYR